MSQDKFHIKDYIFPNQNKFPKAIKTELGFENLVVFVLVNRWEGAESHPRKRKQNEVGSGKWMRAKQERQGFVWHILETKSNSLCEVSL